ncbi:hypothetical protein NDU88_002975 [Pleurodeles waltl]|uniref:Uncharacterized protein n=1 Tax=Pleurodeles waltl TaxID=8319 RepID=A0AAV7T436_PLEWA|nr:hypothetical protein NDU88_002975 [Pleurodeles waltl]
MEAGTGAFAFFLRLTGGKAALGAPWDRFGRTEHLLCRSAQKPKARSNTLKQGRDVNFRDLETSSDALLLQASRDVGALTRKRKKRERLPERKGGTKHFREEEDDASGPSRLTGGRTGLSLAYLTQVILGGGSCGVPGLLVFSCLADMGGRGGPFVKADWALVLSSGWKTGSSRHRRASNEEARRIVLTALAADALGPC